MKRTLWLLVLAVLATAALALALSVTQAAPEAAQPQPYTAKFFGPWNAAMAEKHIPQVAFEKMGAALMITVKVDDHPMDAAKPHYIMWIRVEDTKGKVLAEHNFKATDPAPTATFHLSTWPEKLKVLERCNVHGIWLNEVEVKLK